MNPSKCLDFWTHSHGGGEDMCTHCYDKHCSEQIQFWQCRPWTLFTRHLCRVQYDPDEVHLVFHPFLDHQLGSVSNETIASIVASAGSSSQCCVHLMHYSTAAGVRHLHRMSKNVSDQFCKSAHNVWAHLVKLTGKVYFRQKIKTQLHTTTTTHSYLKELVTIKMVARWPQVQGALIGDEINSWKKCCKPPVLN